MFYHSFIFKDQMKNTESRIRSFFKYIKKKEKEKKNFTCIGNTTRI